MKKQELKRILEESLKELTSKDAYLIEHDVHEQTISSKIACYITSRIPPGNKRGWDVDVEYNRNGEIPKSLGSKGNVRPDIIIHRRGLNNPDKKEYNNLLVIEIKKNPSQEEEEDDIEKVKAFIQKPPYYYCFGAYVRLSSKNPAHYSIDWFQRDDQTLVES